jgi:hypothetical protein
MEPLHNLRCHVTLCTTKNRIFNLFFLLFVKKPARTDQITFLLCVIEGEFKSAKVSNVEQNLRHFLGAEFSHLRVTIVRSLEQSARNKPTFGQLYTEAEGKTLLGTIGKCVVSYSVKP